jgi:hypothetical protein
MTGFGQTLSRLEELSTRSSVFRLRLAGYCTREKIEDNTCVGERGRQVGFEGMTMRIRRCITSLGLVASLLYPFTIAHAQGVDRIAIIATVFTFLREYFSALAQGQVDKIATYHPTLTPQQLDILRNYFAHTIRDLYIRLEDVRVQVMANRAEIVFYRTDRFVDRDTSRPVQKSIRIRTALVQSAAGWQLSGPDQFAFILGGKSLT